MELQHYIKENKKITEEKKFDTSQYSLQLLLIVDEVLEAMENLNGIERSGIEIDIIYSSLVEIMKYFRELRKEKLIYDKSEIKNKEDFIEELADIFIRLMSFVEQFGGEEFEKAVTEKMEKNRTRSIRHGKKF